MVWILTQWSFSGYFCDMDTMMVQFFGYAEHGFEVQEESDDGDLGFSLFD